LLRFVQWLPVTYAKPIFKRLDSWGCLIKFCLGCQIMGRSCAQAILAFSLGCWFPMRSLESQDCRFPPPRRVEDSFHRSLKIMAFGDARLPLCLDLVEVVWFWYSSPYHSRTDLDRVQYSRRFSRFFRHVDRAHHAPSICQCVPLPLHASALRLIGVTFYNFLSDFGWRCWPWIRCFLVSQYDTPNQYREINRSKTTVLRLCLQLFCCDVKRATSQYDGCKQFCRDLRLHDVLMISPLIRM